MATTVQLLMLSLCAGVVLSCCPTNYNVKGVPCSEIQRRYNIGRKTSFAAEYELLPGKKAKVSEHRGYAAPKDAQDEAKKVYLYAGFLNLTLAGNTTEQGLQVNDKHSPPSFINCDGTPNSYVATFPNTENKHIKLYNRGLFWSTWPFWKKVAKHLQVVEHERHEVPDDSFFSYMEINMGGCGMFCTTSHVSTMRGGMLGFV